MLSLGLQDMLTKLCRRAIQLSSYKNLEINLNFSASFDGGRRISVSVYEVVEEGDGVRIQLLNAATLIAAEKAEKLWELIRSLENIAAEYQQRNKR